MVVKLDEDELIEHWTLVGDELGQEDHPEEIKLTLLAALLYCRGREITDTLVDLLIATVHKINARAERRVVGEFVADLKRVSGKENILFKITEAAVSDPDGVVREVVFPAAGGEGTLLNLPAEYKTKGNTFRQHKQRVFKASYTHHYRAALIELIDALEFRSFAAGDSFPPLSSPASSASPRPLRSSGCARPEVTGPDTRPN